MAQALMAKAHDQKSCRKKYSYKRLTDYNHQSFAKLDLYHE